MLMVLSLFMGSVTDRVRFREHDSARGLFPRQDSHLYRLMTRPKGLTTLLFGHNTVQVKT